MKSLRKKKNKDEAESEKLSPTRQKKWLLLIASSVVITLALALGAFRYNQLSQSEVKQYPGNGPDSGSYQVVNESKNGDTVRYAVVIEDLTESELIQINDKLYDEKKSSAKNVYIDYFTDKDVANIYFEQISDPTTQNEQKKELVKHYRAVMVSSPFVGKKLQLVQAQNSVLKSY